MPFIFQFPSYNSQMDENKVYELWNPFAEQRTRSHCFGCSPGGSAKVTISLHN